MTLKRTPRKKKWPVVVGQGLYHEKYDKTAYQLTLLGATWEEMATAFGITQQTIRLWRHANPTFDKAIKDGQIIADGKVVHALYKRATGYEYEEETITNTSRGMSRSITRKKVVPDVGAQKMWLNVRRRLIKPSTPDEEVTTPTSWSEVKEISGPQGTPLVPSQANPKLQNLTNEQIDALVALVGEIDLDTSDEE